MMASLCAASDPVGAARNGISETEARTLVQSSAAGYGYPADRIWIQPETWQMAQCVHDFYCFTIHVDAGVWSPVLNNVAVDRLDATVWDLWECRAIEVPALHKKQVYLRNRHRLVPSTHEPNEFFSDCLDSSQ
jgi:hypothetical protein